MTTAPATVGLTPFTIASRTQTRYTDNQTVSNFVGATSFKPVPLTATGWVRMIRLYFSATFTTASAAAVVAGDAPWNLIAGVYLSDATGAPIMQPISGYNLYLVNKHFPTACMKSDANSIIHYNPHVGPDYAYSASGTSGSANFYLDLDLELDAATGYGCIANLDSNAALQLKVDVSIYTNAFTGTTPSAATVSMRTSQYYWAPVGSTVNGRPAETTPAGAGAYIETRYETQPATASAENTLSTQSRGGMVQGAILISRAAGVRTAFTAGSNVGLVLDNVAVHEGIPLEEWYHTQRQMTGIIGATLTTSYAAITAAAGLDSGVVVFQHNQWSSYRDSYLSTRAGSLVQYKVTPGASATQMEMVTRLVQASDSSAFYARY